MLASIKQSPNYKWWVFCTVATGTFMSVLGHGSVLIALPAIARHFDASLTTVVWIAIGEALTISALLLPMGRLSDIVGRKQVYVVGFTIFLFASAAAGFSATLAMLLTARVVQGVGEAMLQSNGQAMVLSVFPSSERGKALGTQFSVVGAGSIVGMALGGLLVSTLGWRSVFLINIPVGMIALIAAILVLDKGRFVQERQGGQRPRFDWQGVDPERRRIGHRTSGSNLRQPGRLGFGRHLGSYGELWCPPGRIHLVGAAHSFAHAGPAIVPAQVGGSGRHGGMAVLLGQLRGTFPDVPVPAECARFTAPGKPG